LAEGVPLAVGWAASLLDDVAIQVAGSFYQAVAVRQSVDRALARARQAARKICESRSDPSWSLPVLYAATTQTQVFDASKPPAAGIRPSLVLNRLPGMVEGYAPHFIGRRRELQQLLPGLRQGSLQIVLLTGLGGVGKSTLATRLARKLEAEGFTPVALSSSSEKPLTAAWLLERCGDAFLAAGQREAHAILRDAKLDTAERLRALVAGLNQGRYVLVLDNFENNLDEGTRPLLDPELASFYPHLIDNLVGNSRVIITSRYLPADVPTLPSSVQELTLGEFGQASFIKFLLRDSEVERRYRAAELPHELLVRLHRLLGATPRFLIQIREVLKSMSAAELAAELKRVELAEAEQQEPSRLQAARDAYCEQIFTERLYGRLEPASQGMLSRAAVYSIPVTVEALAAAADTTAEAVQREVEQWQRLALAHADIGRGRGLWTIYGMLRSWLLAAQRLSEAERKAAQVRAGDFVVGLSRQDREGELGLNWVECLLEARAQYLAAGAFEQAREVTAQVSGFYISRGLYNEVERLNVELFGQEKHPEPAVWVARVYLERADYGQARVWYQRALELAGDHNPAAASLALHGLATIDLRQGKYGAAREKFEKSLEIDQQIGDRAGEAATWHQLGVIDLNQGEYGTAREKFEKSLEIDQQIGDRAGEAATWHQLGSIDLNQGKYGAAREKFGKSLEIKQQIGNRAGEAATWRVLGSLAASQNKVTSGLRLTALSYLIYQAIGHADGSSSSDAMIQLARQLGYTEEQLNTLLQEVVESYGRDRGASLLRETSAQPA
jgi:tetratricopeptide (TPR) repeat protein